jgi:hypothetical protein
METATERHALSKEPAPRAGFTINPKNGRGAHNQRVCGVQTSARSWPWGPSQPRDTKSEGAIFTGQRENDQ